MDIGTAKLPPGRAPRHPAPPPRHPHRHRAGHRGGVPAVGPRRHRAAPRASYDSGAGRRLGALHPRDPRPLRLPRHLRGGPRPLGGRARGRRPGRAAPACSPSATPTPPRRSCPRTAAAPSARSRSSSSPARRSAPASRSWSTPTRAPSSSASTSTARPSTPRIAERVDAMFASGFVDGGPAPARPRPRRRPHRPARDRLPRGRRAPARRAHRGRGQRAHRPGDPPVRAPAGLVVPQGPAHRLAPPRRPAARRQGAGGGGQAVAGVRCARSVGRDRRRSGHTGAMTEQPAGRDRLRELLDAVLDEDNRNLDEMADGAFSSPFHFSRQAVQGRPRAAGGDAAPGDARAGGVAAARRHVGHRRGVRGRLRVGRGVQPCVQPGLRPDAEHRGRRAGEPLAARAQRDPLPPAHLALGARQGAVDEPAHRAAGRARPRRHPPPLRAGQAARRRGVPPAAAARQRRALVRRPGGVAGRRC